MKFYHGTSKENWLKIQKEGVLCGMPPNYRHFIKNKEEREREFGSFSILKIKNQEKLCKDFEPETLPRRYTYLTPDIDMAKKYGDILLEVEYDPVGVGNLIDGKTIDNYGFNPPPGQYCWQFSVFVPISLNKIEVIN